MRFGVDIGLIGVQFTRDEQRVRQLDGTDHQLVNIPRRDRHSVSRSFVRDAAQESSLGPAFLLFSVQTALHASPRDR